MKRIEAFIQSEKKIEVSDALTKAGVGGFIVTSSLGRGAGERPWVGGSKGRQIEYNAIDTIITVVEDSKVEVVMSTIAKAAYTGTKGDGKIFVTNIENAMDIQTMEKGSNAL